MSCEFDLADSGILVEAGQGTDSGERLGYQPSDVLGEINRG